ncbi:MAG TPA: aldo/keto reductase [Acetobacteraceae bacterium]|nr:aldo/keto reductase [Acetobacteraceae bacterium]
MTAVPVLETPHLRLPRLGLGTWELRGEACASAVAGAIGLGYRHLDTAEMYGNEDAVGQGIARGGVARRDLFLTSKVWWTNLLPDGIRRDAEASLRRLGTEYLDLYLVHWPAPAMDLDAVLRAMAAVKAAGQARAVGVANFPTSLLRRALESGMVPIACNQVEYHVYLSQAPLLDLCRREGIALTAYTPIAKGQVTADPVMRRIAAKHGASPIQVALAWLLAQPGVAAIPKSGRAEGQRANLEAAALRLDAEDLAAIAALPKDRRLVNPSFAPPWDR